MTCGEPVVIGKLLRAVLLLVFTTLWVGSAALADQAIESSGTCFFVDSGGTALTNKHVVADSSNVQVINAAGEALPARIIKISGNLDLALLATEHVSLNYLSLAPIGSLSLGQEVFTIGYPVTSILGEKPKYTEGTISSLSGLNSDDSWIQISAPIQPGNSGGPLVNREGLVVGIVTATAAVEKFFAISGSLPQNVNWAVKADYAQPMVPRIDSKPTSTDREGVISRTEKSVCRVIAMTRISEDVETVGGNSSPSMPNLAFWDRFEGNVITTSSGLKYKILLMGNGRKPSKRAKVTVHYRGAFLNGEEFDSSYAHGQPMSFVLNAVIPGWTEGVQLMPVGSKFVFMIPPQLAYGQAGAGPIPPNTTLIFEVELLGF